MTLIDSMMEKCAMLDKTSRPDGMGGFTYVWTDGAEFEATIIKMSSPAVTVAEQVARVAEDLGIAGNPGNREF